MKKAVVTLLIGKRFTRRWKQNCQESWRKYCHKHGYELICITEAIDNSERARSRSPAWQKCLILGLADIQTFERVVWIDSDIIISDHAPDIMDQNVSAELIGAVDCFALQTSNDGTLAASFYQKAGLPPLSGKIVSSGVLVLSPENHREMLETMYSTHENTVHSFYEMIPLSYEIIRQQRVQWIDPRFNHQLYDVLNENYPFFLASNSKTLLITKIKKKIIRMLFCRVCLDVALRKTYFLHYAGYGIFLDERNFWGKLD